MTPRAVILGILWVVGVCVGGSYSNYMVGSTDPTESRFPSSVGTPFVVGLAADFFLGVGVSLGVDAIWFYRYGHGVPW